MSVLAAYSVTLRVALILIACAMVVALRDEVWTVIRKKPGWPARLATVIFVATVSGGAIISSVNMFPDAGWYIHRDVRLTVVATGLSLFMVGVLAGLYRRALRSGPDRARKAFFCGLALIPPGIGFMWLLTESGAHG